MNPKVKEDKTSNTTAHIGVASTARFAHTVKIDTHIAIDIDI